MHEFEEHISNAIKIMDRVKLQNMQKELDNRLEVSWVLNGFQTFATGRKKHLECISLFSSITENIIRNNFRNISFLNSDIHLYKHYHQQDKQRWKKIFTQENSLKKSAIF